MEPTVDNYKSGSSITLGKYSTKLTEMLPPRSAQLLLLRGPSFPAQSLDLSAELAQENLARRRMHQTILERDPSAFRKKERAESASSEVHNRQKVKDLLGDMHQLKDFKDIDKSKKFTRSILFEQEQEKSQRLKEYQFQTLKPIEDFVRPDDQTSPRVTGYEHGHIRSLLKLDVFGPASSVAIEKDREAGLLPRSPNVDRHIVVNPSHTLTLRPGTGQSTTSSRASTAGSTSYNGAFPSLKMLRKERAAAASQSLDSAFTLSGKPSHPERTRNTISPTFGASTNNNSLDNASSHSREHASRTGSGHHHHHQHHGINMLNTAGAATEFAGPGLRPATGSTAGTGGRGSSHGTRPSSSAASFNGSGYGGEAGASARSKSRGKYPEQTFPGVAITEEERLLGGDPFLRRTMWYKQYASSRKAQAENKETYKREQREARAQLEIAAQERQRMKEFEDYLVLAKYNP